MRALALLALAAAGLAGLAGAIAPPSNGNRAELRTCHCQCQHLTGLGDHGDKKWTDILKFSRIQVEGGFWAGVRLSAPKSGQTAELIVTNGAAEVARYNLEEGTIHGGCEFLESHGFRFHDNYGEFDTWRKRGPDLAPVETGHPEWELHHGPAEL